MGSIVMDLSLNHAQNLLLTHTQNVNAAWSTIMQMTDIKILPVIAEKLCV